MQLLLSKMVLAGNRLVLTSGRALPSVLKGCEKMPVCFFPIRLSSPQMEMRSMTATPKPF